jgi:crotonobetaine/carnitine-CoA ligase
VNLIAMQDRQPGVWLERLAGATPGKPFLVFPTEDGAKLTYGAAFDLGLRYSAFMRGQLGLAPGDNVALMLPNSSRWVKAWFGCMLGGYVDVGIHHDLGGMMLAHQLRAARVKAVACDADTARNVIAAAAQAKDLRLTVLAVPGPLDSALAAEAKRAGLVLVDLAQAERQAPATHTPRDIHGLMSIRFTSGTTGPSKAATLSTSQVAVWADYLVQMLEFTSTDRLYAPYPLHHHLASIMGVAGALRAGGLCIVDRQFSASRYWKTCVEHGATLALILDPVVNILLKTPPSPEDRQHKVRRFYIARPNRAFEERFGGKLQTAYALTEASVLTYMRRGEEVDSPQCVGRPGEHFDVRVVNELDEELPPGEKGEIVFRPRHPFTTMQSYYEDPANTLKACRNLWFHTGDLGSTDQKGNVYFYERLGDTIRRRGVNIPSFHIEEVALAYPGVAEAVAVGVPAEVGEFEVKLCILEAKPNAVSPEGLVRWLGKQLPREMVPRYLEVKDSFSRTITQKVIKRELKEEGITPRTLTTDQWLGT